MLPDLVSRIECWLFEPPDSVIGKPIWRLLKVLRYLWALARDVARGDLTLRAMSLIYTTLLSTVPLIALSFSVLKGLGYDRELEPVLYSFLEPLGDKAADITAQVMSFVQNVRGDLLGSIGLIFLLYNVISMVQKVEESFNFVWRVEQPRSLARRFSEYLSVMVVGPAVLVGAVGLLASMSSSTIAQELSHYEPFGFLLLMLGKLMPYVLVTGVFTFIYAFVPNTQVTPRAAGVGGMAAGIGWLTIGVIFARFVSTTGGTMVIYAGFAVVVIALLWLYISWLVLLLGAQLSFYVQNPQYLRPGRGQISLNSSLRERVALSIMYLIACDYGRTKERWSTNKLADHLELPGAALSPLVTALEKRGLLLLVEDDTWVPGRDPSSIELIEILDAVRHESSGPRLGRIRDVIPAVDAARRAEESLKASLKGTTIKDLIDEK